MNTLRTPPKRKIYPAGICTRKGDWVWQGVVVAENVKQSLRLLTAFKKEHSLKGAIKVVSHKNPIYTEKDKGVSPSFNL